MEKIRELTALKDNSVKREDFQTATQIHDLAQQVRQIGDFVRDLIKQRDQAIISRNFLKGQSLEL